MRHVDIVQSFVFLACDLTFFAIIVLILQTVLVRRQRQHLRWLAPAFIAVVAAVGYRILLTRLVLHPSSITPSLFVLDRSLIYVDEVARVVSSVIFLHMLRKNVDFPWAFRPSMDGGQGAWPPAPKAKSSNDDAA